VVFLYLPCKQRVAACHLNNSKIQNLGRLQVDYLGEVIDTAFVYTPCRMGGLCYHVQLHSCCLVADYVVYIGGGAWKSTVITVVWVIMSTNNEAFVCRDVLAQSNPFLQSIIIIETN
jgi:hypothetical protein